MQINVGNFGMKRRRQRIWREKGLAVVGRAARVEQRMRQEGQGGRIS